ncbi:MAG: MATE family efflux transporter, partial [Spirochaetales bacterium]|nr:MATE family efflux transporter [Spirochaetales bacterium]
MKKKEDTSGTKASVQKDWTQGHILHNILKLSWPMVLSNTLIMFGPLLDMIWVGRLGAVSMAAIASSGITIGLVITTVMGLATGSRAMIARFIGAGDLAGAVHVAQQSLLISLVFSVVMAGVGFFFASGFLKLLGLDADVVAVGTPYVRFMFLGSAAIAFRTMAEGILQASGDTVTPMWASVAYFISRVALSPLLIFGTGMFSWWVFPGMGIQGSAVAMTVAYGLSMVIMLWVLFTGRSRLRVTLKGFRIDPGIIWRIIKIGFPALISMMQQNLSQLVLVRFMAPFGTVAVAAHGLIQRVEGLIVMAAVAVGMGSGVLVGQNLGAGKPERAEKTAWRAFIMLEAVIVAGSAAILLWPGAVIRIFSQEPELVSTAGSFLRIAVAGYVAIGFFAVFMQSLNG